MKGLDPEFERKWCEALRSGDYRQNRGEDYAGLKIRNKQDGVIRYCCLGVACEVLGLEWKDEDEYGSFFVMEPGPDRQGACIPSSAALAVGLPDKQTEFWDLNDCMRLTFPEIADAIEQDRVSELRDAWWNTVEGEWSRKVQGKSDQE
jgi:hypothetical protein